MDLLTNSVRDYDWGSRTAIPLLLGIPPDGRPQAEMWIGAHAAAPSMLSADGLRISLDAAVRQDPERTLGATAAARFGPRLPFLLKVLAAERPLSLQVHPSQQQAEQGYDAEQRSQVPLSAPHRRYRDPYHKPELVLALSRFEALCGFRPLHDSVRLLEQLNTPALSKIVRLLGSGDLAGALRELLLADQRLQSSVVSAVLAACRRTVGTPLQHPAYETALQLARTYPNDAGVVVSLLLNRLTLNPGEALFLAAGNVHAYLRGTAIEIMAASDNVLRGGLTAKHVDAEEFLRVVDTTTTADPFIEGEVLGSLKRWSPPVEEFGLVHAVVDDAPCELPVLGPRIVLCLRGRLVLTTPRAQPLTLERGESAFVAAEDGALTFTGRGEAVVGFVNLTG